MRYINYTVATILLMTCLGLSSVKAQHIESKSTSIEKPIVTVKLPSIIEWTDSYHLIVQKENLGFASKNILIDARNGAEKEILTQNVASRKQKSEEGVVIIKNDIYLKTGKDAKQLTKTEGTESNPKLSPDGKYVAFIRDHNLLSIEVATGKVYQLTTDGSDVILNGVASWVYMEEILGRETKGAAFWWSPDSKSIAFFRTDESKVPLFTIAESKGIHGTITMQRYPKAGDPNPEIKVGIVSPSGGAVIWADFNSKDDQYFGTPYWRPDSKSLWVQWMNRGQDNLKIYEVSLMNGSKREIYNEVQKTWISLDESDRITFLKNSNGFILLSDKSGWRQMYLHDMNGKMINPITNGKFVVSEIKYIDEKNQIIYFMCNNDNKVRSDLYRVNFNGKGLKRLTFGPYTHEVALSPDASFFTTKYSNTGTPTQLALVDKKGKLIKVLGDSKGSDLKMENLPKSEVVFVKSEDGKFDIPMRITYPMNMKAGKSYPVSIANYGGPNSTNVRDNWVYSNYNGNLDVDREDRILVYMDHRGSTEFGKEGQNYLHRNLGYWELTDWISCVKWLIANTPADPKKIYIGGYSYGGYMTCYALTRGAEYFTHGVAGGSVVDWRLYDTHYTERYMDSPTENPEGYKNSSVLTWADKLKGKLLLQAGMSDDNVHVQNTFQLVDKLQLLNKDFEMALYPENKHSLFSPKLNSFNERGKRFFYRYVLEKSFPEPVKENLKTGQP
ncbi:S9 family peptidase [Solitalea lacus]|uniref:S9 family peptidase n=1 Tax=Solitalea lacus TaxID=2911172 RepID=UPI001EDC3D63|nr:DPP IV N-terminal domain-containing protein [Solitalea lacus]UKJ08559.1 S9 family peptidase [Solitalea lacus]